MKRKDIPSDLGLIPDTLIRPRPQNLPPLFSGQWKERLRIEGKLLSQAPIDFLRYLYVTRWHAKKDPNNGNKRPKVPYLFGDRYWIVRDLHKRLYTAIADGDRDTIEKIACTGLSRQLMIKLDHKQALKLPKEEWKIQYSGFTPGLKGSLSWLAHTLCPPWFRSTRILADRISPLPIGKNATLRQVIAEIKSYQTLDKKDGSPPKGQQKTEMVVMQKLRMDGEEDDWMIWGTIEPMTKEQVDEVLNSSKEGVGLMDQVQNKMFEMQSAQGKSALKSG